MKVAILTGHIQRYPSSINDVIESGTNNFPFYLSRALANEEIETHVFSIMGEGDKKYQEIDGIHVHRYKQGPLISLPRFLISSYRETKLYKNKIKFDVIQTGSNVFYQSKFKTPIIFTDHGSPMNVSNFAIPNTPKGILEKMATKSYNQPLFKHTCRKSKKIVMVTKELYDNYRKELGFHISKKKIELIYNGVDTEHYSKNKYDNKIRNNLKYNENVMGCISRISPEKGMKEAIELMPKIIKNHPKTTLLIAGADVSLKTGYLNEIKNTVKKLGLKEHVSINVNIPEKEMPKYYSACDFTILHSKGYDPLPSVVFESMSCSTPMISTDFKARTEVINKKTGILIPESDIESLEQSIIFMIENKNKCKSMGIKARNRIKTLFDIKTTAKRYIELFRLVR